MRYALLATLCLGCSLPRSTLLPATFDGSVRDAGLEARDTGLEPPLDTGARRDASLDGCASASLTDGCGSGDEDCDGVIDEDCACTPGATQPCGECGDGVSTCEASRAWGACVGAHPRTTYYEDADSDGFGTIAAAMAACEMPTGYVTDSTDCDDRCAACHPGEPETCDGRDNDCNGTPDDGLSGLVWWYRDADRDGFGNVSETRRACASPGPDWVEDATDCDDACARCNPDYPEELCGDGLDNNCDGAVEVAGACDCDVFMAGTGTVHAYTYCRSSEMWRDARVKCRELGGQLASFETRAEGAAVWTHLDPYDTRMWIGASDSETEGTWVWESGVALDCTGTMAPCNWIAGKPSGGGAEDCAVLEPPAGGAYGNRNCSDTTPFVCELD